MARGIDIRESHAVRYHRGENIRESHAAITGSLAEAYYGVPNAIWHQARQFLTARLDNLVTEFHSWVNHDPAEEKAGGGAGRNGERYIRGHL